MKSNINRQSPQTLNQSRVLNKPSSLDTSVKPQPSGSSGHTLNSIQQKSRSGSGSKSKKKKMKKNTCNFLSMIGTGMAPFVKPHGQKEGINNNNQSIGQIQRTHHLDDSLITPKNNRRNYTVNSFGQTILTPLSLKARGVAGDS